jgi:hypothetical protein
MKRSPTTSIFFSLVLLLSTALLLAGCVQDDTITGDANANVLSGSVFTITERTLGGGTQMSARGTVRNDGKNAWSPVWVVEGQFYADSTFSFKLGGATKSFTFSLAKGESTLWDLKFTSTAFDLADYPHFAVKNLRVTQQ